MLRTCGRKSNLAIHWATCCLLFSLPGLALGQSKDSQVLVDKLATTNPPATIRGEPGDQRASWKEFDSKEAKRIDAALKKVISDSEELWPELIEHLEDDRYCKTVGIDAGYPRNWSVGEVCQHVIGETLSEPYYRHMSGSKQTFHKFRIPAFAKDKARLREWCLARKGRNLYELQIEACEWALGEIKGSDEELTTAVKKEIDELKKTKKPVPCPCAF